MTRIASIAAGLALCGFTPVPPHMVVPEYVPFVPTPMDHVEEMMRLARPGPGDVLYDLGSGDGRILIMAVERFGVSKAVGVELDPEMVRESLDNVRKAGVDDRVEIRHGDMFEADFRDATVVALYLFQHINVRLKPRLLGELRPGTRIVTFEFHMGRWMPDAKYPEFDSSIEPFPGEDYRAPQVFLWYVPASVEGRWRMGNGDAAFYLDLAQTFQLVEGTVVAGERSAALDIEPLRGDRIRFSGSLPGSADGRFAFDGRIDGDAMTGDFATAGRTVRLRGERLPPAP